MKNAKRLTLQRPAVYLFSAITLLVSGCTDGPKSLSMNASVAHVIAPEPAPAITRTIDVEAAVPAVDPNTILSRPEVPILCYHQIRDYKPTDSKTARAYIVPVAVFREQMKALADSGYHAISPDQLQDYLVKGKSLPSKPVMITFDDTRVDQYAIAMPELNKYGYKGVFFIMTVSLGRPGYMSKDEVKTLSDQGHTIGSHTWDHQSVKKYTDDDWNIQIVKPSKQLQAITGKHIDYFAYPFGLWNKDAIAGLRKHSEFKAVYQLSAKRDDKDPLYSIRRIIVPGSWSGNSMLRSMRNSF